MRKHLDKRGITDCAAGRVSGAAVDGIDYRAGSTSQAALPAAFGCKDRRSAAVARTRPVRIWSWPKYQTGFDQRC
jgi:hypothetical protein